MTSSIRHGSEPATLIDRVNDIKRRLAILERNPRASATAIDTGNLRVKIENGIIVQDEDNNDIIVFGGDSVEPKITLASPDPDDDHLFTFGASTADMGLDGFQTFVDYEVDPDPDHGFAVSFETGAAFGKRISGVSTWYFESRKLDLFGLHADSLRLIGRFLSLTQMSNLDAIYTGVTTTGAVSSITISYPITFATTIVPVLGVVNATAISFTITAQSTASFTVAWTGGAVAKTINLWNVRL